MPRMEDDESLLKWVEDQVSLRIDGSDVTLQAQFEGREILSPGEVNLLLVHGLRAAIECCSQSRLRLTTSVPPLGVSKIHETVPSSSLRTFMRQGYRLIRL